MSWLPHQQSRWQHKPASISGIVLVVLFGIALAGLVLILATRLGSALG